MAIENGLIESAKILLEHNANPNLSGPVSHFLDSINGAKLSKDGQSSLHIACMQNQTSVVPLLLEHKANPNTPNAVVLMKKISKKNS